MVVPDRIVQAERLVALAPTVAGPFVLLDDDGRHIELAQARAERDAALPASDDDAIGLARDAEFGGLFLAPLFPRDAFAIGAVFYAHGPVETLRFLIAFQFGHGGEQRPDLAVLQADVAEAARRIGLKLNPALDQSVGVGRVLAIGDCPVRRPGLVEPRLQ